MIQNREEGTPQFSSPAVFVPSLKMTIQAGHFVSVMMNNILYIRQIITTSYSSENEDIADADPRVRFLKLNWYCPRESLQLVDNAVAVPVTNIYAHNVSELFQTPWYNWVKSSHVKELVFVFHYDDVVTGTQNCAGMENAFFT